MLSLLETQLKTALAAKATWAVRWKGSPWDESFTLTDGGMPVDGMGKPLPAIEAEISGFSPQRAPGREGKRRTTAEGHLRLVLSWGIHTGTDEMNAEYGRLDVGLARKNVFYDSLTARRIYLMDVKVTDGVGFYEDGNREVRLLTIPWFFFWFS